MRYELEPLFSLADRYHDAEEKADDQTCMDSYDTALSIARRDDSPSSVNREQPSLNTNRPRGQEG